MEHTYDSVKTQLFRNISKLSVCTFYYLFLIFCCIVLTAFQTQTTKLAYRDVISTNQFSCTILTFAFLFNVINVIY